LPCCWSSRETMVLNSCTEAVLTRKDIEEWVRERLREQRLWLRHAKARLERPSAGGLSSVGRAGDRVSGIHGTGHLSRGTRCCPAHCPARDGWDMECLTGGVMPARR
jgi:hypothetical protein